MRVVRENGTPVQDAYVVGPFHRGSRFLRLGYRDCRVVLIPIDLETRPPQKVEVVFQKGVTVTGLVTDPLGRPVPGVDVTWQREHTPENVRLRTTTDEKGVYEIRGLEPTRYFIRVESLGCGMRRPIERTLSGASFEHVPLLADCVPSFDVAVESAHGERRLWGPLIRLIWGD